jgi:riboflavin biosynthesis pyrimidine reductase
MEMGRARENPLAQTDSRPIETILSELRADGQRALIEAGVSLLHIAIQTGLVDEFYLTLSTVEGDGNFFNRNVLEESFALISEEILHDERFQLWTKR